MKLTTRASMLGKKFTLISAAFVLAVSSLTAAVPFVLTKDAFAAGPVVISNVAELRTAIENQADGQTWTIQPGSYGLAPFTGMTVEGRSGWHFPITADNLTITGVGNPIIYGTGYSANGNWETQNLMSVFGDDVTVDGLTLMPKISPNKTIEVLGEDFSLKNSTIAPNTYAMSDYSMIADLDDRAWAQQWGGSLYFSHAGNHVVQNVTIKNAGISYRYSPSGTNITFGNVVIENTTEDDFTNSYRYSSGFNNAGNTVNGSPTVVYHVSSALNNLESVLANVKDGDVIELDSDLTLSTQLTLNKAVTVKGNGRTVTGAFVKSSNSNNAVIGVQSDGVSIQNLVVDAVSGATNQLHGINVYESQNVVLSNVTAQNGRSGVVVGQGSTVAINGIHTSGNIWHGVNIDKPGAHLVISGSNTHTEAVPLFVDNRTVGTVVDADNQYDIQAAGNADIYLLNVAPSVSKLRLNGTTISGQYQRTANCQPINSLYAVSDNLSLTAVAEDLSGVKKVNYSVRKLLDNGCSDSAAYRSATINLEQSSKNPSNWNQPASAVLSTDGLNGKYTMVVVAEDQKGAKTVKYIDLDVDNTAPQLSVDAPADLTVYGDSLSVTGSVSDPYLKEYKYQILDANKQNTLGAAGWSRLGGTTNTTGELFSADISGLADGTYHISVWASDIFGNATNLSGNRMAAPYIMQFTIDRGFSASIAAIATNTTTPTISGLVQRNADGSAVAGADVEVFVDGTPYAATTGANGEWSVQPTVAAGNHIVALKFAGADVAAAPLASALFVTTLAQVTPPAAPVTTNEDEEDPLPITPLTNAAITPLIINPAAGQAALGSSDEADTNDTEVEGASTQDLLAQAVDADNTDGNALGLAWYWWLLIIAGGATGIWWLIAALRGRSAQ